MLHAGTSSDSQGATARSSVYASHRARVEDCFERRRQCHERHMLACHELDAALSRSGPALGPDPAAAAYTRLAEWKERCMQADAACAQAAGEFTQQVIERARGFCRPDS